MVWKSIVVCSAAIALMCLPPALKSFSFGLTVAGWIVGGGTLLLFGVLNYREHPWTWFAVTGALWSTAFFYIYELGRLVNAGSGQDAVQLLGLAVGMAAFLLGLVTLGIGVYAMASSRSRRVGSSPE